MVTFAQAQERAEEWINGEVPAYERREVRIREFELGFVVWAEDRAEGGPREGGAQRLVIARDGGAATLWPALPVGEVIVRYEELYGAPEESAVPVQAAPPERADLNHTSFLLSPPEWLQEAADRRDRQEQGQEQAPGRDLDPGADEEAAAHGALGASASLGAPEPAAPPAFAASAFDPPASAASGAYPAPSAADDPEPEAPGEWGTVTSEPSTGSGAPHARPAAVEPGDPAPYLQEGAAAQPQEAASGATPWAGTDTNADAGEDRSVPLPATVFAPPLTGLDEDPTPPPDVTSPEAKTALMPAGSQLPATAVAPALDPSYGYPQGQGEPGGTPQGTSSYGAPQGTPPYDASQGTPSYGAPQPGAQQGHATPGDIADAATSKAEPPRRGSGATPPPPPGAPGTPGAGAGSGGGPSGPGGPAGGYVPTQLVSALGPDGPGAPGTPPPSGSTPPPPGTPRSPSGGVHQAATMLSDPSQGGLGVPRPHAPGAPGAPGTPPPPGSTPPHGAPPPPPGAPGTPGTPPRGTSSGPGAPAAGGGVHQAATMLAGPAVGGPGAPLPPGGVPPVGMPGAPGAPGAPGGPGMPPPAPGQGMPGAPPAMYGYPQPVGQPIVGPGYQAVLRYRAADGSEQQLIRRSAPGMPHPEWQILHELQAMNVPPQQVLELHTELESCELPGAYCARMIRENWPQARITSIAPYGRDHASRQQGMQQLLAHQGELHQVADGPARLAPVRAPLQQMPPAPPLPPEGVAHELAGVYGPGVFRFDQRAVSRQGVPEAVATTLMWAGLPVEVRPFFWAQAQPGRPVPTLLELAQERGVQPGADAGSYLVMGSDFGRAICVQYGTAHIVAVPVEGGPGGAPVPPQFVNTGLPEFVRCLALLGRMWRLRLGLNQEQAGRWTVDFQAQLASLDPAALSSPESWWAVLLEQMWDGLL